MRNNNKTELSSLRRIFKLCLGLLLLLVSSLSSDEVVLNLRKGWGLYSLPLSPDANGEETLFSLKHLWTWDGRKFVYPTTAPKPYTGFLVYSAEAQTVHITGLAATLSPLAVESGWGLLDHKYALGTSLALRGETYQQVDKESGAEQEAFWVFCPVQGFVYPFPLKSTGFNASSVPYWTSQDFELQATFQDGKTFAIPVQLSLDSEQFATIEGVKVANMNKGNQDQTAMLTGAFAINGETQTVTQKITLKKVSTYLVVDLLTGNYYTTDTSPNLNKNTCRTTELWLRRIPAGTFMMGSPANELGRNSDETQHQVTLTDDFYIGVFEVTQKQYELMMGDNPSTFKGDTRPVEGVSTIGLRGTETENRSDWPQTGYLVARDSFLGRLRLKTGLPFELPTEAQWEYACRAGTSTALNSNKNLTDAIACQNLAKLGRYKNNQSDSKGQYAEHTKVGSYLPNNWGLYDMHGNVAESCLDHWSDYGAASVTNPVGGDTGACIGRGGSWLSDSRFCRSASRGSATDGDNVGARLVVLPSSIESSLSSITITGPDVIASEATVDFSCIAVWENGMEVTVSPKWSLSSTAYATVSAEGKVTSQNTDSKTHTVILNATYKSGDKSFTASKTIMLRPLVFASVAISGSLTIAYGASETYVCTAAWSNGETAGVSPTWQLSDKTYATISGNTITSKNTSGLMQTVTLKATYKDSGVTKSASIDINLLPASAISISIDGKDRITAEATEAYTCMATFEDGSISVVSPSWSLSNTTYATVSEDGKVISKNTDEKTHTTVLTATYKSGGKTISAKKTITLAPVVLATLSINGSDTIAYNATEIYSCAATWSNGATTVISPTWQLSSAIYATVSADGKVTSKNTSGKKQTVTLKGTYKDSGVTKSASHDITLLPAPVISIAINGPDIIASEATEAYTCIANFADGATAAVYPVWSLSSTTYATVSEEGKITSKNTESKTHSVVLTATYKSEGKTFTTKMSITLRPLVLVSVAVKGSDTIAYGSSASYSCTVFLSNGTETAVSPTWQLSSTAYATVSADGKVTNKNTSGKTQTVNLKATYNFNDTTKSTSITVTLPPRTLASVAISGNQTIAYGASEAYDCLASWGDGSTSSVVSTWSLSSTAYATVAKDGKVTSKNSSGATQTVNLEATYKYYDTIRTATIPLMLLSAPVTAIAIDGKDKIAADGTETYSCTAGREDGLSSVVTPIWSLSNDTYASVSDDGQVTNKNTDEKTHTVNLIATYKSGNKTFTAKKSISLPPLVPVSVNISGLDSIVYGATEDYDCTVVLSNGATIIASPTWQLSNKTYASVSEEGKVTNKNTSGKTQTVTLTSKYTINGSSKTASIDITLLSAPVLSIAIDGKDTIVYGATETYACTLSREDGATPAVSPAWSISSNTYASISEEGEVTNKNTSGQEQTITLTATYKSGDQNFTATKTVTLQRAQAQKYLIVDLLTGNHRESDIDPDLNDNACRTTELWLRLISAGTFMMGSPSGELGRDSEETEHQVTLTDDFYIGVFEVTQKQYELLMGKSNNPSSYKGDTRPVEKVSSTSLRGVETGDSLGWPQEEYAVHNDSFIGRLRVKTGLPFELPTEAQWEYACRAGTTTALNSNKDLTKVNTCPNMAEVGRYKSNQSDGKGEYSQHTTVGSYQPNDWDLYDMHGNVAECCLDYESTYETEDVTDPVGGTEGLRVVRGGSWLSYAKSCRSSARGSIDTVSRDIGARLVVLPSTINSKIASLAINGPDAIDAGATEAYICMATWNNGMAISVTPTWKLSSKTYASISEDGKVTNQNTSGKEQTVTLTATYAYKGVKYTATKSITLLPATLVSIAINGPDSIDPEATASYTCTATWNTGTTSVVTPTWKLSSTTYATLSGNTITNKNTSGKTQTVTLTATYTFSGVTKTATKTITLPPAAPTIKSIAINGPDSIEYGKTAAYTLTVTWSDGTITTVTATWKLSSTTHATVSADGKVTNKNASGKTQTVTLTATYTFGGVTKTASKTITLPVAAPTIKSIAIDGPESIDYGKSATYTLTITWSDGTTTTVTGTWKLSSTDYAALDGSKVTNKNTSGEEQTVTLTVTAKINGVTKTITKTITLNPDNPNPGPNPGPNPTPSPTVTLRSIAIQGSDVIAYGESASYICIANWSDGTTSIVYPDWKLLSTLYATLSGNTVTNKNTSGTEQSVTLKATYTYKGITETDKKTIKLLPEKTLISISISGPSIIKYGESEKYTCTATWSDKSTSIVTPKWSLSDDTYASVSADGTVTNHNTSGTTQYVILTAEYTYKGITKTATLRITLYSIHLESITIIGPDTIAYNKSEPYICQATWSDKTKTDISAKVTWELSSTTYASLSGSTVTNKNTSGTKKEVTLIATIIFGEKTFTARKTITLLPAAIKSIAIEGKSTIASKTTETYVCVATKEDGKTINVTPTWSLSSNTYATVTADGKVTNKNTSGKNQQVTLKATYKSDGKTFTAEKTITLECENTSTGKTYLVVNLQTGKYRETDTAPNLNDDTCKTTELWLRRIPAGTFTMGSPEGELGRDTTIWNLPYDWHLFPDGEYRYRTGVNYESQHKVTLTKDFYIGVFEVTQKQYELITDTDFADSWHKMFDPYANDVLPAYSISYDDIRGSSVGAGWPENGHAVDSNSILGKLRAKTGLTFDLPTEAQWEYACRAGTTTALNSGKNLTNDEQCPNMAEVGRYRFNQGDGKGNTLTGFGLITPETDFSKVGSYRPNSWGLYDMHGNVQEWCLDYYYAAYEWCWDWDAYDDPTPVINPQGPTKEKAINKRGEVFRVLRGGYDDTFSQYCRSAARDDFYPYEKFIRFGFRLVCIP